MSTKKLKKYFSENDIDKLFDIWNEIEKQSKLGLNNKLIYTQYDPIEQFIFKSNPESIDKLICNDKQLLKHIENSLKSKIKIITPTFIDTEFLFDYLKLTSQIRNLFQKKVEVTEDEKLKVVTQVPKKEGGRAVFRVSKPLTKIKEDELLPVHQQHQPPVELKEEKVEEKK